jgi:hypothetical protein
MKDSATHAVHPPQLAALSAQELAIVSATSDFKWPKK